MDHCVNIRRGHVNDARSFCRMTRALIETGLPPTWNTRRLQLLLTRPDTNAYTLLAERQLAGFSISVFGKQRVHLVLHAIAPAFSRRGLGKRLLDWQLEAALIAGLNECTLEVRAGNHRARAFYEASGFRAHDRLPGYYSGREDALRMRLNPIYAEANNC